MSTRDRNALLTLMVFVIVLVSVWPLAKWKAAHIPPDKPPLTAQPARAHHPVDFRSYAGPTTNFLGQEVAVTAVPYLASAVRCARVVAAEADKYPKNRNPYRALKRLEEVLWEEDYAYAALVTGGLNRTNAMDAYARLDDQSVEDKGAPLAAEGSPAMGDYYRFISNGNAGYSNVLQILAKYTDRSPFETDLLKDAGSYSALTGENNEWLDGIQKQTSTIVERQTKLLADRPEMLQRANASFAAAQDQRSEEFKQIQDSYRTIFGYRLSERDGITDPALLNDLAANPIIHSGPEFRIP